jgi:mannitol/fructose-specific phosphotransferase system IIA component (Ntr-type)
MGLKVSTYIRKDCVFPNLTSFSKEEVLGEIARNLAGVVEEIDAHELLVKLVERENKASTGADKGVAIPHATLPSAPGLLVAIFRSQRGIDFGALDNERSHIFFTIVSPLRPEISTEPTYLQVISAVCKLMRSPNLRTCLLEARSPEEICEIICREELVRESRLAVGQS